MPPITYEDVARDSATRVMEKFRERSAESRSLTMRASGELYEIIRAEVLSTLEQFGRSAAMGAKDVIVEFSADVPEGSSPETDARLVRDRLGSALAEATTPTISPGDVVRLRSGGAMMTVGELRRPAVIGSKEVLDGSRSLAPMALCHWHDNDGAPRTEMYALAALKSESR